MSTTPHQEPDTHHAAEESLEPVPVAIYLDNPLKYNWERSSKVGTITGGGMGAAVGGAIGGAGLFIGAIPGAIIGSLIGMVAGIALGAAGDAVAVSTKTGV